MFLQKFEWERGMEVCVAPRLMRVKVMRMAVRGSLALRLPALLCTHVGWKVWLS